MYIYMVVKHASEEDRDIQGDRKCTYIKKIDGDPVRAS